MQCFKILRFSQTLVYDSKLGVQSAKVTKSRIYGIIYRLWRKQIVEKETIVVVDADVCMYLLIHISDVYWHLVHA